MGNRPSFLVTVAKQYAVDIKRQADVAMFGMHILVFWLDNRVGNSSEGFYGDLPKMPFVSRQNRSTLQAIFELTSV